MIEAVENFEQVVQNFESGSRLLRAWTLTGGVSAQVTALEVEHPDGQRQKMIVRQHGEIDRKRNPRIAVDEFRLLHKLHTAGLSVPAPIHVDETGEIFPTPYIVIEFIDGTTESVPDLDDLIHQSATFLATLHRVDASSLDFLPSIHDRYITMLQNRPETLDESLSEGRIRDALETVFPLPQVNDTVLLHGDFWHGNILWQNGQLAAVIDWEDAALGDPLADLANSRLEILWAFGMEAMDNFTQQYQAMMPALGCTHLPYWDLCAALRPIGRIDGWGLDTAVESRMREQHHGFVEQAFLALI